MKKIKRAKGKFHFSYGWRPELPDNRDMMYSAPMGVLRALPPRVDLRDSCPPVLNQGTLGSCTANAIASAHQFGQIKQMASRPFEPSRLFIYYNEREMEGNVTVDSGAFIRDGFKSLARQGVCPEKMWKYKISEFTKKPSVACYEDALEHQALQYMRLSHRLSQLKGCVADGYPFVFGFSVYESFESQEVARTGVVPLPNEGEEVLGGHAVLAVGDDDESQRFIVQNSWGTTWGDKGYFYMPYSYLTDSNLSDDMWTLRLVELTRAHDEAATGGDQDLRIKLALGAVATPIGTPGLRITKVDALERTKRMLQREWNLSTPPPSDKNLRNAPPAGLGKSDTSIRALERPIELADFRDVAAEVIGENLLKAKTVAELRDKIWDGIPASHK
jgi:hypothetical protein